VTTEAHASHAARVAAVKATKSACRSHRTLPAGADFNRLGQVLAMGGW
jgi:hypothetical protein